MIKRIPEIGTRKMISICLTLVFCYMALTGKISSDQVTPTYAMVLGFYFGRSTALDIPGERKPTHE